MGWYNLFLQMCGDIKPVLKKYNLIDVFEFEQVKEKWGGLRCYYNFGFNYDFDNKEIDDIVRKYEHMATLVCTQCGDIATHATCTGWISSFCDKCISDSEYLTEDILTEVEPEFSISFYELIVDGVSGEKCYFERTQSFKDEWNRYKNLIGAKSE